MLHLSYLVSIKVKYKFSIEDKNLILQDDTGVEVDEDVFTEVLEERSHDILWRVIDQDSGKSIQYIFPQHTSYFTFFTEIVYQEIKTKNTHSFITHPYFVF